MLLTRVMIQGFRSIEQRQAVEVGSPTILSGHNDAGKTAVLDAIAYLLDGYKLSERDRTFGPGRDDGGRERVPLTMVEGEFELRAHEQEALQLSANATIRKVRDEVGERLEVLRRTPADERLRDPEGQKVETLKFRLEGLGLETKGLKSDLVARINLFAANAETVHEWVPASSEVRRLLPRLQRFDATSSQDPEQAIVAALRSSYRAHLDDEEVKGDVRTLTEKLEHRVVADAEVLREHIRAKCADIGDIHITPVISWDAGLRSTEVSATNARGEVVHLSQSGAGRARRIALAVWEHNAKILGESGEDVVLLYDEPDTHLDYRHQRGFMSLLMEQSKLGNVRVVVASHSMNLIDGVDIAQVLHLEHVDSRTQIRRLTDDSEVGSHLGAIAASLGLRNTVLLHERLFVGVEGDSEARALPVLFKLAEGRHLESCGIALWPCGNNDGALRFAQFLRKHDRQVVVLVDEDSRDLKTFSDASLSRHDLDPKVHLMTIGHREFEDTFSDGQWASCAEENWPRQDGQPWTEAHFGEHRADKKFSGRVEKMLREESSNPPSGKPEMMATMAVNLRVREDVPSSLRDLFKELVKRGA